MVMIFEDSFAYLQQLANSTQQIKQTIYHVANLMKHVFLIHRTEKKTIPVVGIKKVVPLVVLKIFLTSSRSVLVSAGTAGER